MSSTARDLNKPPPWLDSAEKARQRQLTLDLLRQRATGLVRDGQLACSWVELCGPRAPTLTLLQAQDVLGANGRFIGVDKDAAVVAACRATHAEAAADWHHALLEDLFRMDREAFPNMGVLVYDSLLSVRGEKARQRLQLLAEVALARAAQLGEFMLVLNFSLCHSSWADHDRHLAHLATLFDSPLDTLQAGTTRYRNSKTSNWMALTRLWWGL